MHASIPITPPQMRLRQGTLTKEGPDAGNRAISWPQVFPVFPVTAPCPFVMPWKYPAR